MKQLLHILILLPLAACATVTADHDQRIQVSTVPAGASCTLTSGNGSWEIAKTPRSVAVARGFSPLVVTCSKKGAGTATETIEAKTRGRAYGNIALLGVPAVVDAATGAGYVYEPDSLNLKLSK